jgi:rod shape determining protein RodA
MAIKLRLRLPPIDVPLALAATGLVAIGLLMVYSATSIPGAHEGLWGKQMMWCLAALVAASLAAAIPYRAYDSLAMPLFGLSILFLILVLVMGTSAYGAKRWLELGPLKFQPSELAKIAMVLVLARRFDNPKLDLRRFRDWFPPVLLMLVPFLLVLKEPDLGTSLSFPIILIAMFYWRGMPLSMLIMGLSPVMNVVLFFLTHSVWWFAGLFVVLVALTRPRLPVLFAVLALNVLVAVGMPRIEGHLEPYQKQRIHTFLNPEHDPSGAGYQVIQSKIAIGSGGKYGKGYLKGTQKGLAFLPMRHTDFIFSVVGEELGMIGALTVVLLYAVLILRGIRLAEVCRNEFASLMGVGLIAAFFYHIMVNIMMTIGWAPVTGLPLPLLSYGGTALIVNSVEIGLLQNIAMRRHET